MKIKSVLALMISTLVVGASAVPCFASSIPLSGSTKVLATTLKEANTNPSTSGICRVLGNILREESSREWKTGYISTAVNVREKPDLDSKEVGNLFLNDTVSYYKYNDSWYAIIFDEKLRYVSSEYVSDEPVEVIEEVSIEDEIREASLQVIEGTLTLPPEVDLFSRGLTAEGSVLGYEGMMYIGSVVLNRVESADFGNSIKEVFYEEGQYECVSNGSIDGPANPVAIQVAMELLENGSVLPKNVVYQAEFPQGEGVYCTVGNTYFCY